MLCQADKADNLSLVTGEALARHLFIFSSRPPVIDIRMDGDASAWGEKAQHLYIFRIHQLYKIIEDYVDAILMEATMIPETEKIQFQALAFDHTHIRNVADPYLSEIGLSGNRTECREFRAVETNPIVPAGMHVGKSFKYLRRIIHLVAGSVSKGFQPFFLSIHILEIKNLERVVMNISVISILFSGLEGSDYP